jgi:trk system potassium uptake protein TrkH
MNNLRPILLVIGILLTSLGCAQMLPAIYDLSLENQHWEVFAVSSTITLFFGILMTLASGGHTGTISIRQAFVLTAGAWFALTAFGALPFALSATMNMSYTDAFFEAMSGITTTGSTVIGNLDKAPPGILLWRGELQWIGGLGVIVMAVAVLPILKVGGMQFFRVEAFDTSEKILPRATQISGALILVYTALTLICAVAYNLAGMNKFDAVVHAMTTVATGGMSTHDASFGHFDNLNLELIAILFMILGSLPFLLYVKMLQGHRLSLFKDAQVLGFFKIITLSIFLAWTAQATSGHEPGLLELRDAAFSVVSIMTGTGFTTVDYSKWGVFSVTLFFVIMFIGGCSGSTSCGIKVFRFQVVYANLKTSARKILHPNGIFIPHYNGQKLNDNIIQSVMTFLFLFVISFLTVAFVLTLFDLDIITALSASATSLANVGPGLGAVGPAGNFKDLPDAVKWILAYTMLLGRLEIFAVLIFFLPKFWK